MTWCTCPDGMWLRLNIPNYLKIANQMPQKQLLDTIARKRETKPPQRETAAVEDPRLKEQW